MPRPGPRRELLAVRIDAPVMKSIQERADREGVKFPDYVRRLVAFGHAKMPEGYDPSAESE